MLSIQSVSPLGSELPFPVTTSALWSRFTSPIAIVLGPGSVWYSTAVPKLPSPRLTSTLIELRPLFAVAMSGRPSPLRSPTANAQVPRPPGYSCVSPNVPSPEFKSTETVFGFPVAMSSFPSPFRSAIAMSEGSRLIE